MTPDTTICCSSNASPSTTLSDPQLMKPLFGFVHPPHVLRTADKQQPGEDLLYERPNLRKCQSQARSGPHPFGLEKRVGDGTDHHMVLPPRVRQIGRASCRERV